MYLIIDFIKLIFNLVIAGILTVFTESADIIGLGIDTIKNKAFKVPNLFNILSAAILCIGLGHSVLWVLKKKPMENGFVIASITKAFLIHNCILTVPLAVICIILFLIKARNADKLYLKYLLFSAFEAALVFPLLAWIIACRSAIFEYLAFGFIIGLLAILFIFGLIMSIGESMNGESGDSRQSSPVRAEPKNSKAIKKKKEEIERLKQSNMDYAHYNEMQAKGEIGYQFFSADKNREIMRDQEKAIEDLSRELEKLEKED